jgi:hypothetical protein
MDEDDGLNRSLQTASRSQVGRHDTFCYFRFPPYIKLLCIIYITKTSRVEQLYLHWYYYSNIELTNAKYFRTEMNAVLVPTVLLLSHVFRNTDLTFMIQTTVITIQHKIQRINLKIGC